MDLRPVFDSGDFILGLLPLKFLSLRYSLDGGPRAHGRTPSMLLLPSSTMREFSRKFLGERPFQV